MNKTNFLITTPELQKEINHIEEKLEQEDLTYSMEECKICDVQLSEATQITPELQLLVTENMNDILNNMQNIIQDINQTHTHKVEEYYKTVQSKLIQMAEQYNTELLQTKKELNTMQQSNLIYKNEINKLMRLIYARNCLIEKLAKDIQELQKQQHSSSVTISSKILF